MLYYNNWLLVHSSLWKILNHAIQKPGTIAKEKKKDNFNDYYGTMMEACNTNKPATGASFYI